MIKGKKIVAVILMLSICFGIFGTIGFAEESNDSVDPTVYNDNSMLFCYVMKVLLSKDYGDLLAETNELKPLWMLAHEIYASGKYNEDYRNTKECIKALTSSGYVINTLKTSVKSDFTKRVSAIYAGFFTSDLTKAEVLSKCLVIENYVALYPDLVAMTDEVKAILDFCENTIDKIKKDTKNYNLIINDNLTAFSELAESLEKANRNTVIEEYPELQRLYLASNFAKDADTSAIELYENITLKYFTYTASDECTIELVDFLSKDISADDLYYLLCGIDRIVEYANLGRNDVLKAKTTYLQELDKYNKKYVKHNDTVLKIHNFAGSLPADYAVSSCTDD